MRKSQLFLPTLLCHILLFGQENKLVGQDSIVALGEVIVRGFDAKKQHLSVPASVSKLTSRDLNRFGNVSLVPVVNTVPGVRLEERSPGSYRLSIRGSLLRSPFGVRNVKIYWDEFLLTDAGGNSYLNLVDLNGLSSLEIMKGPAGSIYGAGTGGALTLSTPLGQGGADSSRKKQEFTIQMTAGSYGQFSEHVNLRAAQPDLSWQVSQGHYQSDGYRNNSRMRRDLVQGGLSSRTGEHNQLDAFLLAADLDYRTPGGLTLTQMQNDPRQSRPATPVLPSAAEQKAGVRNQTVMAGLSNRHRFNPSWSNTTSATFSYTYFRNPFITNYETRAEWNGGLRSKFLYEGFIGRFRVTWISGLEWQEGRYRIDSAGNNKGEKDTSGMVTDQVRAFQGFLFSQADLALTSRLGLQAGISLNDFGYHFERTQGNPQTGVTKAPFEAELVPRLALYVKITPSLALHASASKGFSPPTLAEISPSAGRLSLDLQAEQGWSYEAGGKGSLWRKRLQFDATLFRFTLDNAIVRRVNAAGAEYFTNAGGTRQQGLETYVEGYPIISWSAPLVQSLRIWTSATFSDFTFENYSSGSTDYSGNELTGVPRQVVLFGWDLTFLRHLNWNTTFNYTSRLPLNDANSVYASDYRLWQSRLGWKKSLRRFRLEIFAGVDNAADELYSLGNDINAFGGRYYNPAPVRNYYGGALIHW